MSRFPHIPDLPALEQCIKVILPEAYQESYEQVQPVSMGSASLHYGPDGQVAWNEIWQSFCHLAMAGGPPHKGKLLLPPTPEQVSAAPDKAEAVRNEICRGIGLVTEMAVAPSARPGWVTVTCDDETAASWLARAIVMENVSAFPQGQYLELPAGPDFRLEKEVKNVITSLAKTFHYWDGHMWPSQQREIRRLFATATLLIPAPQAPAAPLRALAERLHATLPGCVGWPVAGFPYAQWIGLAAPGVRQAIWLMRALAVVGVAARREESFLYLPLAPEQDPEGTLLLAALRHVAGLGAAKLA